MSNKKKFKLSIITSIAILENRIERVNTSLINFLNKLSNKKG